MSNQVEGLNDIFAYSQVIQGTLILLSALVGVAGYVVQSKMKAKERQHELDLAHNAHLKQLRLERTREQLAVFAGPASMYTMNMWQLFWATFAGGTKLDKLGNGKIGKYMEKSGFNFKTFISATHNELASWIGPDLEEKCRQEPSCLFAVHYRNIMTRLVLGNAVHLSKLLKLHSGHLSNWTTGEKFKKQYPCAASSGWARNLFFLQFCNWADEFEDIIQNQWSKKDYTLMFPAFAPYPAQVTPYLLSMVTRLREAEVSFGASDRIVESFDKEMTDLDEAGAGNPASKATDKKKKYAVSAAAAGVAAIASKVVTDNV